MSRTFWLCVIMMAFVLMTPFLVGYAVLAEVFGWHRD